MADKTQVTDSTLASRVKKHKDNEALKELIARHSGIYTATCRKFFNSSSYNYFQTDLLSEKDLIIYEAALTYDKTKKCKFSTWLANRARYHCLNSFAKQSRVLHPDGENSEQIISDSHSCLLAREADYKEDKDEQIQQIRMILEDMEDESVKKVIQKKYFGNQRGENVTFLEIANELKVSRQTVLNWHKKFIKYVQGKKHHIKK